MVYVVIDTFQKNVVRAVYRIPEGMDFQVAERIIKEAHADGEREENDIVEELAAKGFESESWLPCEI